MVSVFVGNGEVGFCLAPTKVWRSLIVLAVERSSMCRTLLGLEGVFGLCWQWSDSLCVDLCKGIRGSLVVLAVESSFLCRSLRVGGWWGFWVGTSLVVLAVEGSLLCSFFCGGVQGGGGGLVFSVEW